MAKLVVLGYDGLDPSMLEYMPVLHSRFKSTKLDTIVPLTYPSWTTIMTGVPPSIHGILDFFYYYKESTDTWKARLFTANDLRYPRLHEILNILDKNIKYAILDPIPPTPIHPPRRGSFIGRIWGVGLDPLSLPENNLSKFFNIHTINKLMKDIRSNYNCSRNLDKVIKIIYYYHDGIEKLIKQNYDLVWTTINFPDMFIHKCRESLHKADKYLKPILVELDNIAKTVYQLSPNTVVVSDHGFRIFNYRVNINRLLHDYGFIKPGKGGHSPLNQLYIEGKKKSKTLKQQWRLFNLLRSTVSRSKLLRGLIRGTLVKLGVSIVADPMIDEYNSKAYSPVPLTTQIPPIFVVLVNDPTLINEVAEVIKKHADLDVYIPTSKHSLLYTIPTNDKFPVPGSIKSPLLEKISVENHSLYGVIALDIEGLDNQHELPPILPSTTVTPLALCILGIPFGAEMPSKNLASQICKRSEKELGLTSYSQRWNIYRRIQQKIKLRKTMLSKV